MKKICLRFNLVYSQFLSVYEDEASVKAMFEAYDQYCRGGPDGVFEGESQGERWSVRISNSVNMHTFTPEPANTNQNPVGKTNVPHLFPRQVISGQTRTM